MKPTDELPSVSQEQFEAMMRRYLAKIGARYAPVLAVLLVLGLILLIAPTTQPDGGLGSAVSSGGQGAVAAGPGPMTGAPSLSGPPATTPGVGGGAADAVAGGVDQGNGALPTTSGTGSGDAAGSSTTLGQAGPVAVPTTEAWGVAKTGVTCGPGVRQFAWSIHSPLCVPAFSGNNGGATAHGVTASTITLSYRIPDSAEDSAIAALTGAANVNEPAMVADMESYIKFFNTQFELYGRHVVLKPFKAQGDYISEDQGQDLGAAQADAVTAHDLGVFGDTTFALGASSYYEQDLAAEHVMSFSAAAQPQSWFEQYAPYEYSVQQGSGTNGISEAAAVVCRRLAGLPAIFSGDTASRGKKRVFGIVFPETPSYALEVRQYQSLLSSQCGVKVAKVVGYAINIAEYTQEALSTVALMPAANVTTVLCACDPIFPILLTPSASGQGYHPEWFGADFGDPVTQDYSGSAWNEIADGLASTPASTTEAYRSYLLGNPGKQPAEEPPTSPPYFYVPYYTLLQVFEGLQAAGPDLTPATFEQGMFSLPASVPGGDPSGGAWVFGQNVFDPVVSFGLVWWDPNVVSVFDSKKGAYQACNSGQIYTLADLAALGGPGQQLHCFGK